MKTAKEEALMQFIDVSIEDAQPGDLALHVNGQLDAREVVAVNGAKSVVLDIMGKLAGPLPKKNYTYRRRVAP